MANALAKNSTVQDVLSALEGYTPERTAYVQEITFTESQFEGGKIDTTTGQNVNGSNFYRTTDYISLPSDPWMAQLFAEVGTGITQVTVFFYDSEKVFKEYATNYTGYVRLKSYPYCRIHFYNLAAIMSNAEYITTILKIQYIMHTPAENEYFLTNHLFNGNFEYDRNENNVADGWVLKNSPTSSSMSNNTQVVTPSTSGYFIQYDSDNRLIDHKVYVAFSLYTPYDKCYLRLYGTNIIINANDTYTRASMVLTAVNSDNSPRISCYENAVDHAISIRNVMMIDLTDIFGAGNEPTAEQIDSIVDTWYGGYVPCEYVCKYDDSNLPLDVLSRLKNIDNDLSATDNITFVDGEVSSVSHYVGGILKSTTTITRDNYGNIVSVQEVLA